MTDAFNLAVQTLRASVDILTSSSLFYFVGLAMLALVLHLLCKYIFRKGGIS